MKKFVKSFVDSVDMFKGGFGFQSGNDVSDAMSEAVGLEGGLGPVVRQLVQIRDEFGLQKELEFSISTEGLVLRISDNALFDRGVEEVSPKAFPFPEHYRGHHFEKLS